MRAYAAEELNIDMDELVNPWAAASSSMLSFTMGAAVPLLAGAFIKDQQVLPCSAALGHGKPCIHSRQLSSAVSQLR